MGGPSGRGFRGVLYLRYRRWVLLGHFFNVQTLTNTLRDGQARPLSEARWPDLQWGWRPQTGHRAMVLVRFCPAAVSKELLTSDFEQHFRVISGLEEARVVQKRLGKHGTT